MSTFKAGDHVIVKAQNPTGHIRTPMYLRGKRGVILRDYGAWPNPEELAYGGDGLPKRVNYWVQFRMAEVWGNAGTAGKAANPSSDTIAAEIYEHWLEPDPASSSSASGKGRR